MSSKDKLLKEYNERSLAQMDITSIHKSGNEVLDTILDEIRSSNEFDTLNSIDNISERIYTELIALGDNVSDKIADAATVILNLTYGINSANVSENEDYLTFSLDSEIYSEHHDFIKAVGRYRTVYSLVHATGSEVPYLIEPQLAGYEDYDEWSAWTVFYSKMLSEQPLVPEISKLLSILSRNDKFAARLKREHLQSVRQVTGALGAFSTVK